MQESQETSRTISLISHEDDGHFIINMHALHNATLLQNILPRHLTTPKPLYTDRIAQHHEIATELRVMQAEKCARTAAKTKAMKEANKAKKLKQRATVVDESDSDGERSDESTESGNEEEVCGRSNKRRRGD
jgi:hypothetical protein